MIEHGTSRGGPLRPGDPTRVGPYQVLGRLGAGGMGVVFLAQDAGGRPVAVKVVHSEMAADDEFRNRFRSEVTRVRQVPPFCTAEVIDADPDAPRPYLVTEFVDGPSLAEEVSQRGPLTSSNLHAVAIGVATALTAIHEAGVIHRDLKPHNVLLAPGTPKVIDFGIARAWEATTEHTRTGQIVGTANYMAPERFDESGSPLTPASDVFAWGCVVTYAGTGRAPFHADSSMAIFARILTQAPDLTGLDGRLRRLVERSLARDPKQRPTARELLDLLLGGGEHRSPPLAAALDEQPELRTAAIEIQAASFTLPPDKPSESAFGPPPGPYPPAYAPSPPPPSPGAPYAPSSGAPYAPSSGAPYAPSSGAPYAPSSGAPYAPTSPPPYAPMGGQPFGAEDHTFRMQAGPGPQPPSGGPPPRRRNRALAGTLVLLLALIVAGGGGFLAARAAGAFEDAVEDRYDPGASPGASPGAEQPDDAPPALTLPKGKPLVADSLTSAGQWSGTYIVDEEESNCDVLDGALRVQRVTPGSYICDGPDDKVQGGHTLAVTARIEKPGTCIGIWLFWEVPRSYSLTACENAFRFAVEREDGSGYVIREYPLDTPLPLDEPLRMQVVVEGVDSVSFGYDDILIGEADLPESDITGGSAAAIGIISQPGEDSPPYAASFNDIEVRTLD